MSRYYLIQGIVQEVRPVEKYGHTFRNLVVNDTYIHVGKNIPWSHTDIQAGDEVAVTCFDQCVTVEGEEQNVVTGVAVVWIRGRRSEADRQTSDTH